MNKPDWKDAPEWANWLAQEYSGEWTWFQFRPSKTGMFWFPDNGKHKSIALPEVIGWEDSLEQRPKAKE